MEYGPVAGSCDHDIELFDYKKGGEFLHQINGFRLPKNGYFMELILFYFRNVFSIRIIHKFLYNITFSNNHMTKVRLQKDQQYYNLYQEVHRHVRIEESSFSATFNCCGSTA
jgi:hypothetical protein